MGGAGASFAERVVRRLRAPGWGLADQAVYAFTNFAAAVVVARALGPDGFGVFALVMAAWSIVWVLNRAIFSDPFVLSASGLEGGEWRSEAAKSAGAMTLAAGALGLITVLGSSIAPIATDLKSSFVVLGLTLPALILQDHWRVAAFTRSDEWLAFLNDSAWAVVQFCALGLLWIFGVLTPATAVLGWALGGVAGCIVGGIQLGVRPDLGRSARAWGGEAGRIGVWFGLSRGSFTAGVQLVYGLVAGTVGLAATGGLRGVFTLFGPLGIVVRGLHMSALPAMSRSEGRVLTSVFGRYTLAVGFVGLLYGGVLVLGGERALSLVYGDSYRPYRTLLLPVALLHISDCAVTMATLLLRRMKRGKEMALLEGFVAAGRLAACAGAAAAFGILGVAWALAATALVRAALYAWMLQARIPSEQVGQACATES